jgi:hypothetical protein
MIMNRHERRAAKATARSEAQEEGHFRLRAPIEIVAHDDGVYVRESITCNDCPMIGWPAQYGPFADEDQASRFLRQRGMWLRGYLVWLKDRFTNPDAPPYPSFMFEPDDDIDLKDLAS